MYGQPPSAVRERWVRSELPKNLVIPTRERSETGGICFLPTANSRVDCDNFQRRPLYRNLNRSLTNIFSVRVNIKRTFRFDAQPRVLEILHLVDRQVTAAVNRREQAKHLERTESANHAYIEQSVVHSGFGSNLHPTAVDRSIGEGSEQ